MGGRCLVLGAGFSKAVADLPVTCEFFDRFKELIDKQDRLGNKQGARWGREVVDFVKGMVDDYAVASYSRWSAHSSESKQPVEVKWSNYFENFEASYSFLDLSLQAELHPQAWTEAPAPVRSRHAGKQWHLAKVATRCLGYLRKVAEASVPRSRKRCRFNR